MYIPLTAWQAAIWGQLDAVGAEPTAAAASVQSIWDFVSKGGPMMIPIAVCSMVAMTVVIERLVSLRRRRVIPPAFLPGVIDALGDNGDGRTQAMEYCQKHDSPIARLFAIGIKKLGEPVELLEKRIQEFGEREALKLRKHLRLLSVTASIAPLMGLLGTIFGMIMAFQTVATSGDALGKAELLAQGIYQAMITTAAGLLLAIPVLVAYHWLSGKIEALVTEMDLMTVDFIEDYALPAAKPVDETPRLRPAKAPEAMKVAAETA